MTCRSFLLAALALAFAACGSSSAPPRDGGATAPTGSGGDSGTPGSPDSGSAVDSGTPAVDSGTPLADSGTPAVDSGTPVADSGTPAVDSGTPAGVDSGTPEPTDAGPDAGTSDASGLSLASTVTLVSGASPAGVTVTLTGAGSPRTAAVDPSGAWDVTGLSPGEYRVSFAGNAPLPPDAGFPGDGGPATLPYSGEIPSVFLLPDGGAVQFGKGLLYAADGGLIFTDAGSLAQVSDAAYPLTPLALPAGNRLPGSGTVFPETVVTAADGHFAFVTSSRTGGDDTLWLAPPGGAPAPVATGRLATSPPRFSPDGRYLSYLTDPDANRNGTLWLVPVAGGNPVQVTGGAGSWSFSPDGTQIALSSFPAPSALSLYAVATGQTAVVSTSALFSFFSADGTEVATVGANGDGGFSPAIYTVASRATRPLPAATFPSLAFSPVGATLLVDSAGAISLYDADGGTTQVTAAGTDPVWSPDGTRIAYVGTADGGAGGPLNLYDVAADSSVQVAPSAAGRGLLFSPAGTSVAFFGTLDETETGPLSVYTIASRTTATVATQAAAMLTEFTGDGSRLIVPASPTYGAQGEPSGFTLEVYEIAKGQAATVATGVTGFVTSADFRWLGFFSGTPDGAGNRTLGLAPVATGTVAASLPGVYSATFGPGDVLALVRDVGPAYTGMLAVMAPGTAPADVNDAVGTWWFAGGSLVSLRTGTAAPYGNLDGLWVTPLP